MLLYEGEAKVKALRFQRLFYMKSYYSLSIYLEAISNKLFSFDMDSMLRITA